MISSKVKLKTFSSIVLALVLLMSFVTAYELQAQIDNMADTPTTGFEARGGDGWTTHTEELAFLEEVAVQSERMTYSQVGISAEGKPLHVVRVGFPEPPSDENIADGRNILIVGSQHGNEPAGREMSLQMLRDLAFTEDADLLNQLSEMTVLFIPSANPDGSETHTRSSSEGVNLNRDHLNLNTPEIQTVVNVLNQFDPDIIIDAHERSGSNPDFEMLWPRNLNMDEELRSLNVEMVQDHLRPDVEDAGYSTGLYGYGSGDERFMHNTIGLRHSLGLLLESSWTKAPDVRVDMHMEAVEAVFRFYRERSDEILTAVTEAPERKEAAGAEQEPFYLDGADNEEASELLNPASCGYLLNASQAEKIIRHIEMFSLETEQVSENGVFVTMAQPMMTVVPLLLDDRANYNMVNGLALYDCTDPGSLNPPEPPEPMQYETDFTEYEVGTQPDDWSSLWKDSNWTLLDNPRRLEHRSVGDQSDRRALTWDKAGVVYGDVEMSAVVRARQTGQSKIQLGIHMSGEPALYSGSQNAYYIDIFGSGSSPRVRINRYFNDGFTLLDSAALPFEFAENAWYQVVIQREGDLLRTKVWPYGENEPDQWQVTVEDRFIGHGRVGLVHLTDGVINDWAFIGVGTAGDSAPRAPEDLFPEIDKSLLQLRMNEIIEMNLDESHYTQESWLVLQDALSSAENVLNNPEATQPEINAALTDLNEAFSDLETPSMQYETDFSNYAIGSTPEDWSSLWRESNWTILDEPRRLEHRSIGDQGARRALTWDKVGEVRGDVEVSAVVKARDTGLSKFQLGFHMNGAEDNTDLYYLDVFQSGSNYQVRLNRYSGSFSVLGTSNLPFTVEEDSWYQTVVQREGDMIRAKVWPFGEDEPSEWQVEVTDSSYKQGKVGLVHLTDGVVNDWAFVGVGTGSETAPRAPEDLFEPEVDKTELQDRVDEINAENLNEDDYTEESWQALQDALETAENVLNDLDATQTDVDVALEELNDARNELEYADTPAISAENMITSIERFAEEGAFESDSTVRSLTMHLTAVSHYERQEKRDKVVKHMEGFKLLLDYQKENELISDEAYNALYTDAELLIEKWQ